MEADEIEKIGLENTIAITHGLGLFGLKMLLTLNSGATVVLLALLGSVIKEGAGFPVDVPELQAAMLWFLSGIGFAAVSVTVAYVLLQFSVIRWPAPPINPNTTVALMVIPALLSLVCFAVGSVRATYAFG